MAEGAGGGSGASAAIDAVVRTSDSECKTVTTLVQSQSQLEPLQAERAARRAAASSSFAEARPPESRDGCITCLQAMRV